MQEFVKTESWLLLIDFFFFLLQAIIGVFSDLKEFLATEGP